MTRMRLITKIRKQAYYKPMLAALAELGIVDYDIAPPKGRGHPILSFEAAGGKHRIPIPGSPSGSSEAAHYVVAEIRRRAKGLTR